MAHQTPTNPFSRTDTYALARALVGLDWHDLPVTPVVRHLLSSLDVTTPEDAQALRHVLGQDVLRAILLVDPNTAPPDGTCSSSSVNTVPDLPPDAQLTGEQLDAAGTVGQWLRDYVSWAGSTANETPLLFHEGAGLWLAALAIGRRLYIHTPWGQEVFPNVFVMLVAVSTYYRKSAGLSLAGKMARAAIPHLLLPQPGSPEAFMGMLGGVLPPNFESFPAATRDRLNKGNAFAAQRGILRDELSALFKSFGKDFMSGMKELLMQLYDCPEHLDSQTNQRGLVVIHNAALSLLGAATPAEWSVSLSVGDWHNGALARFLLLTPEPHYQTRPAIDDSRIPDHLISQLRALHEALPTPPEPQASGEPRTGEAWLLAATDIWPAMRAYEHALRAMTAPDSPLDDRLRATYGRLHVQALKAAIILASLDWIALGDRRQNKPVVRVEHWYRAQQMAETWRASAHRLLRQLGESEEVRLETRILKLLAGQPLGLSVRSIYRTLGSPRKPVAEALKALELDGRVVQDLDRQGERGPRTESYRLVNW
jgi:hypothetical protein